MNYCAYYQAKVDKSLTWFFVATFRSFEYIGFDRTLNVDESIFEFFVPNDFEKDFLNIMHYYESKKIVSQLSKLSNRFITE